MSRTLAIGDIHGCATALDTLLAFIQLQPKDQIVTVGDYVDRGPNSRGVIDRLIRLKVAGQLVPLRGNHELMMWAAREDPEQFRFWWACGGDEALNSYAQGKYPLMTDIPANHWHFIRHTCSNWYETDTHIFVHANLHPDLPLDLQTEEYLFWNFLDPTKHTPHHSGKIMVCGHSEQRSGKPLNLGSAICIDTWAYGLQWLTCLDVDTGKIWQANELGQTRESQLGPPLER